VAQYALYDVIPVAPGRRRFRSRYSISLPRRATAPIGDREEQKLVLAERKNGTIELRNEAPVRFVPLLGSHGWAPEGNH
jgi:protein-L-isoaspartate O-methyltransferase